MGRRRLTGSVGERLLTVLAALVEARQQITLAELTNRVGLPKATVQRLLALLENQGYAVNVSPHHGYVAGPQMRRLSLVLLESQPQQAVQHAILKALADDVGEACNLVLLDGDELTYVDRVDTAWPLRLQFDIGSHVPLHCTATGKLLLALQPKAVRDRLIKVRPLRGLTAHSITDPEALENVLKIIRRDGVGTDDQEFLADMVAVAVPVAPPSAAPVLSVSIHAPTQRHTLDSLGNLVPRLRTAAAELADVLYEQPLTRGDQQDLSSASPSVTVKARCRARTRQ